MRSSLLTTVLVSFSVAARLILFLYTFTTAMRISVRVTCPPKERRQASAGLQALAEQRRLAG